ncbi:hypothetical protein SAMN04488030_2340 [Aliiroseovarius halocynthiae]|nr:hypothetical protein SAMN04488030_2340 [Aliiroseovarius halocynthiae]
MNGKARFTYGDVVTIAGDPHNKPALLKQESICGISSIASEEGSLKFCAPLGSTVYLVEFSNGSTVEVPESAIRLSP